MDEKIVDFCRLLRRYGISLSPVQVLDALRAVELVGVDNPQDFYHALRANLIISREDLPLFENLFRLYFCRPLSSEEPRDAKAADTDGAGEVSGSGKIESVASADGVGMGTEGEPLPQGNPALLLVKAVRRGDYALMRRLAERAVHGLGAVRPEDFKRLDELVARAKANLGWEEAVELLFPSRGF